MVFAKLEKIKLFLNKKETENRFGLIHYLDGLEEAKELHKKIMSLELKQCYSFFRDDIEKLELKSKNSEKNSSTQNQYHHLLKQIKHYENNKNKFNWMLEELDEIDKKTKTLTGTGDIQKEIKTLKSLSIHPDDIEDSILRIKNELPLINEKVESLKKLMNEYNSIMWELDEIDKKTNHFLGIEKIKKEINKLKSLSTHPDKIKDSISRIKNQLPLINEKVESLKKQLNELKEQKIFLEKIKEDPHSTDFKSEIDELSNKMNNVRNIESIQKNISKLVNKLLILKIKNAKDIHRDIYFDDIQLTPDNVNLNYFNEYKKKINNRIDLWKKRDLFFDQIKKFDESLDYFHQYTTANFKKKYITDILSELSEIKTEKEIHRFKKINKILESRKKYIGIVKDFEEKIIRLSERIISMGGSEKNIINRNRKKYIKKLIMEIDTDLIDQYDLEIIQYKKQINKLKIRLSEINELKDLLPGFAKKLRDDKEFLSALDTLDSKCINSIDHKIFDSKRLINRYNKLKDRSIMKSPYSDKSEINKINDLIERGKKEGNEKYWDHAESLLDELKYKGIKGNPFRRTLYDGDSYGKN